MHPERRYSQLENQNLRPKTAFNRCAFTLFYEVVTHPLNRPSLTRIFRLVYWDFLYKTGEAGIASYGFFISISHAYFP